MATRTYKSKFRVNMGDRRRTGPESMTAHLRWFKYLHSNLFVVEYGRALKYQDSPLTKMQVVADTIINLLVYLAHDPITRGYVRSRALINSVKALLNTRGGDLAGFDVVFDPEGEASIRTPWNPYGTAGSKWPSLNPNFNYAAYFLGAGKSFIKDRGMPHRDFMGGESLGLVENIRYILVEHQHKVTENVIATGKRK